MSDSTAPDSASEENSPPLSSGPRRSPSVRGFSLRPAPEKCPELGALIGERYVVEGFLGEGGTATVHLARELDKNELVVVKRMKPCVASTPELRQRFLMEARALACVDHPSVIRVLDIEEPENEPPFLALEALRGESLGDYLKREGCMSVEMSVQLLRQIARALEAVHDVGMVHRDVKPDNIFLVGPVGEPSSIKVLDFGMALLSDEGHDENSTSILGTAQYMAPEQILVEPVDARTDVYSLGVVMFRMITGHLPFDAHSKNDLLRHQLFSPVPPASWLHEDIVPVVERIIHKATRKAPEARFQNMAEMFEALDGYVGVQDAPPSVRLSTVVESGEPDVYAPQTERGRHAARVLSAEFGVYSRPHSPSMLPTQARG